MKIEIFSNPKIFGMFSFSSGVNPPSKTQQIAASAPCSIAIPRNIAPIPTAKNILSQGDKTLPIKAAKNLLETSSLKISAYNTIFLSNSSKIHLLIFLQAVNQSHAPHAENLVQILIHLRQCCKKI